MSAIFAWETPPPKARGGQAGRKSRFADALTQLRNHPGQWARVTEAPLDGSKALSHAARIRHGAVADTEPGEFDASDHEGHVFVKYDGPEGVAARKVEAERKAKAKADRHAKRAAAGEPATADEPDEPDDDEDDDDDTIPDDPDDEPALIPAPASTGAWG